MAWEDLDDIPAEDLDLSNLKLSDVKGKISSLSGEDVDRLVGVLKIRQDAADKRAEVMNTMGVFFEGLRIILFKG